MASDAAVNQSDARLRGLQEMAATMLAYHSELRVLQVVPARLTADREPTPVLCAEPREWRGPASAQHQPVQGWPAASELFQLRMPLLPRDAHGAIDLSRAEAGVLATSALVGTATEVLTRELGPARTIVAITHVCDRTAVKMLDPVPFDQMSTDMGASAERRVAIVEGVPLQPDSSAPPTLGELLELRARQGAGGFGFIDANGIRRSSTAEFHRDVLAVSGQLRALGLPEGSIIVLQLGQGREHLLAFWGCILAGLVPAMPSSAPRYAEGVIAAEQLPLLCERVGATAVMTSAARQPSIEHWLTARLARPLPVLVPAPSHEPAAGAARRSPDDLALVLFTSGSTGIPKAVPLRHRMVLAEARAVNAELGTDLSSVGFNWMPLDHAGLLLGHITVLLAGAQQYVAETEVVLRTPGSWIRWLSDLHVTYCWAPNVGFAQALEEEHDLAELDLRSVRALVNAGETVNPVIARRFLRTFAAAGLREDAVVPGWGMSETSSLSVLSTALRGRSGAGTQQSTDEATGQSSEVVAVGVPVAGVSLRIVGPDGSPVREGEHGQLQIRGPLVFDGYIGRDRERDFDGAWFRTGDVGMIIDGRLSLTGRSKDIIILNGRNMSCGDVETALSDVQELVPSSTVAAPFVDTATGAEELAVFFVPRPGVPDDAAVEAVRQRLVTALQVTAGALVPIEPDDIPRTAIGKPRRPLLGRSLAEGGFPRAVRTRAHAERHADPAQDVLVPTLEPASVVSGADERSPIIVVGQAVLAPKVASHLGAAEPCATDALPGRLEACPGVGHVVMMVDEADGTAAAVGAVRTVATTPAGPITWTVVSHAGRRGELPTGVNGLLASARAELSPEILLRHLHVVGDVDPARIAEVVAARWPTDSLRLAPNGLNRRLLRLVGLPASATPHIIRGGRYVVTGGAGGIGQRLCRFLVDELGAQVLIVGRSPSLRIRDGVRYTQADIATGGALREAVEAFERQSDGLIDGLFHLAGVGDLRAQWDDADRHLISVEADSAYADSASAKVAGTLACIEIVKTRTDARLVLFSSAMGHSGGRGFAAYAAANAAQQQLFEDLPEPVRRRSTCLEWSMWRNIGMSRGAPAAALSAAQAGGFRVLDPDAALRALQRALSAGWGHRLILGLDPESPRVQVEMASAMRSRLDVLLERGPSHDELARAGRELMALTSVPVDLRVVETLPVGEPAEPATLDDSLIGVPNSGDLAEPVDRRSQTELALARLYAEVLATPDTLDLDADFLKLGGHSLSATRLAGRIMAELGVELATTTVFENPVLCDLAGVIDRVRDGSLAGPVSWVGEPPARWPATMVQKRLWLVDQLHPGMPVHNVPVAFVIEGAFDVAALRRMFQELVGRHRVLRATFELDESGELFQVARAGAPIDAVIRILPEGADVANALEVARAEATRPFNLSEGPLARLLVVALADGHHVVQVTFHHLAVDGRTVELLLQELVAGAPPIVSPVVDFPSYALWEFSDAGRADLVRHEHFWRRVLSGRRRPLWPAPDFEPGSSPLAGSAVERRSAEDLREFVQAAADDRCTTPFAVTAAAFSLLVHKYTGVFDFIMGTPSLGRRHAVLQRTVGSFAGALALRCRLSPRERFVERIERMHEALAEAHTHDPLPIVELAELLAAPRVDGARPGFDVWFALDPDLTQAFAPPGTRVEERVPAIVTSKFALQGNVRLEPSGVVTVVVSHALRDVGRATATLIADGFLELLPRALSDPQSSCAELLDSVAARIGPEDTDLRSDDADAATRIAR